MGTQTPMVGYQHYQTAVSIIGCLFNNVSICVVWCQLIRVNESLQSVVALSISTHCLLFILRIPIIFLPISILLVFVVCGSKPAVSAGQTTNKFLSCLCRKNTHSLGCVYLPYLEITKFLSRLYYCHIILVSKV